MEWTVVVGGHKFCDVRGVWNGDIMLIGINVKCMGIVYLARKHGTRGHALLQDSQNQSSCLISSLSLGK